MQSPPEQTSFVQGLPSSVQLPVKSVNEQLHPEQVPIRHSVLPQLLSSLVQFVGGGPLHTQQPEQALGSMGSHSASWTRPTSPSFSPFGSPAVHALLEITKIETAANSTNRSTTHHALH